MKILSLLAFSGFLCSVMFPPFFDQEAEKPSSTEVKKAEDSSTASPIEAT